MGSRFYFLEGRRRGLQQHVVLVSSERDRLLVTVGNMLPQERATLHQVTAVVVELGPLADERKRYVLEFSWVLVRYREAAEVAPEACRVKA